MAEAHLIANERSKGNFAEIKRIFFASFLLMAVLGFILSLLFFLFSFDIAKVAGNVEASSSVRLISLQLWLLPL